MSRKYSNQPRKTFKSVIYFLICFSIMTAFRIFGNDKLDVSKYINSSPAEVPEMNQTYNQTEVPASSKDASFSALDSSIRYSSLTNTQKDVYNAIQEAVSRRASFINIEHNLMLDKDFDAVWNTFLYTDPYELTTWAFDSGTRSINSRNQVISIKLQYRMDTETMKEYLKSTQKMVKKIAAEADGMNNYDKAKYFHDYLVLHSTYSTMLDDKTVHTAYGCLVNGYCVCDGYARAYKLLCDEAGIPCDLVIGGKDNDNEHIWNLIQINGEWRHVDVTYDDPVGAPENYVRHDYFYLTTAEISQDHIINQDLNFPMP